MSDILARILATKAEEVAAAKRARPYAEVAAAAREQSPPRDFERALRSRIAAGHAAVIAEIKKASPSRGVLRADFDPSAIAASFAAAGAACLSVLTDRSYFQGDPAYLTAAREACALPALRKDFMYEPYQVAEARTWGADCILIIMAGVDDATAKALEDAAFAFGMDVLIEVHNADELARALKLKSRLIGINNRDLKTFDTTLATSERLAPKVPLNRIIVGESGISTPDDVARLARVGIRAILVGESLMRQGDVEQATRALIGDAPRRASAAG